jgi:hypothetical protein
MKQGSFVLICFVLSGNFLLLKNSKKITKKNKIGFRRKKKIQLSPQ